MPLFESQELCKTSADTEQHSLYTLLEGFCSNYKFPYLSASMTPHFTTCGRQILDCFAANFWNQEN